jgi:bifunctional DNase/RNase
MSPTSTEGDAVDVEPGAASTNNADADSAAPTDAGSPTTASTEAVGMAALVEQDAGSAADPGKLVEEPGEIEEPPDREEFVGLQEPAALPKVETGEEALGDEDAAELDAPDLLGDEQAESQDIGLDDDLLVPPEMSQMLFVDVVLMLPATHPVVVLQEADSPFRELRIPVGGAEGIAIGYAARGIATPRPLTHELFARVLEQFGMNIDVVRITDVSGSAYTAEMVVSGPQGVREIDCRPSDAIALALRQRLPVPIVASPMVMAIAGTDPLGAN